MIDRLKTISLALIAVLIIAAGCLRNSGSADKDKPAMTTAVDTASVPSVTSQAPLAADEGKIESRLKGRWQRSDGNYLLQVFTVAADSTLKAGYYNPNPVNVESGEWTVQEGRLYIRVILRDVNYPGSTYVLEYQPGNDILAGNYYQAVDGVNYDVMFSRVK
jgi:hypothetical protein